jgi:hypothetical protein
MKLLKRIINYSTAELEELQQAIYSEIDRRKNLTAEVAEDGNRPRLAIAPESDIDSAPAPRPPRRAA